MAYARYIPGQGTERPISPPFKRAGSEVATTYLLPNISDCHRPRIDSFRDEAIELSNECTEKEPTRLKPSLQQKS